MSKLIKESQFLNENVAQYEKRMESKFITSQESVPNYITYYHICNNQSTTDSGFKNVEKLIGPNSPIRYKEIKEFPVYGLEQIIFDLDNNEEGLNITFEGDVTILPNTIQPYPDDLFVIPYLKRPILFRVTGIRYDNIKSHNYYQISMSLESTDIEVIEALERQIIERCTYVGSHIGSEFNCIVQDDVLDIINKIEGIRDDLMEEYYTLFYSKRFNAFLLKENITADTIELMYDRLVNMFIQHESLFNERDIYKTIFLTNEDYDNSFEIDFHNSFFNCLEKCTIKRLRDAYCYRLSYISRPDSVFTIHSLPALGMRAYPVLSEQDICPSQCYIPPVLIDAIKMNKEVDKEIFNIIIMWFNGSYKNPYKLPIKDWEDIFLDKTVHDYILAPAALYCLREFVNYYVRKQ